METENTAMENDDFFSGFDTGEPVSESEETTELNTTETVEESQEAEEATESEENAEGESVSEDEEKPTGEAAEPETAKNEDTFDIVVDGKAQTVTREEGIALMQKGGAFDRVKQQRDEARDRIKELEETASKTSEESGLLDFVAQQTGMKRDELPLKFFQAFAQANGISKGEVEAKMKAFQLERQLNAKKEAEEKEKQTSAEAQRADRARADLDEFQTLFPGVKLNDALTDSVKADVSKGMSLANAYQKYLNQQEAAKLEQERKKAAAEEKNRKNRRTSPGSQKTGGGSSKTDDFFSGFKIE